MKKLTTLLMLCLVALAAQAGGWDEQQYKQIEQIIRVPQFAEKSFLITKYGAVPDNQAKAKLTAKEKAAKNQKAIQKAIDKCSANGGGRVVVPAGQKFLTAAIQLKSGVNLRKVPYWSSPLSPSFTPSCRHAGRGWTAGTSVR